jgi:undecaprenyl-diphosphatase
MDILQSIILSVIQGLTEFLPISSSGHLALADKLFGPHTADLRFFAIAHLGTMFATIWVFWDEIIKLFKSLGTIPAAVKEKKLNGDLKMVLYIIIASVPTGIMGIFLKDKFESLTSNVIIIGICLVVTGIILLVTRFVKTGERDQNNFGFLRALILGTAQGIAILPGVSRSGTTIAASLYMGADRKFAGRLSFLISLPAIFAVNLMEWFDPNAACPADGIVPKLPYIIGFVVSFGVGLLALKILLKLVENGKFWVFAFYCFALGVTAIILGGMGII